MLTIVFGDCAAALVDSMGGGYGVNSFVMGDCLDDWEEGQGRNGDGGKHHAGRGLAQAVTPDLDEEGGLLNGPGGYTASYL